MSKYALSWALELLYLELYVLMIQDYLTEKKNPNSSYKIQIHAN